MARRSEQQHPFYKPLWVRIAIVAVILFWLGFEYYMGAETLWIALAVGMLVYAVYTFFLTWPGDTPKDDSGASP